MKQNHLRRLLIPLAILLTLSPFSPLLLPTASAAGLMPYGSMTPLNAPESVEPWWPDSLRPVAVSHVGRHGARFLSSEKKVKDVRHHLDAARARGSLTEAGERTLAMLDTVCRATADDWGMLTPLGFRQEHAIGRQMTRLAPELYADGAAGAIATTVPRVVQTMYALCSTLARASEELSIYATDSRLFDPLLRFFECDSAYVSYLRSGQWRQTYEAFYAAHVPTRPAEALVGKQDAASLRDLTMALYAVIQGFPAAGLDISPYGWMNDGEMQQCAAVSNLRHYLQRCANPDGDEPARAAVPLLRLILDGTDPGARPADWSALLRFGHAETLLPLFSLMALPGCGDARLTPDEVAATFDVGVISPLGANLQLYILEAPSGRRHVAALLNGRAVPPVPGEELTVSLDRFRSFMEERISRMTTE